MVERVVDVLGAAAHLGPPRRPVACVGEILEIEIAPRHEGHREGVLVAARRGRSHEDLHGRLPDEPLPGVPNDSREVVVVHDDDVHAAGDESRVGEAADVEVPVGAPVGGEDVAAVEDRSTADARLEEQTVKVKGIGFVRPRRGHCHLAVDHIAARVFLDEGGYSRQGVLLVQGLLGTQEIHPRPGGYGDSAVHGVIDVRGILDRTAIDDQARTQRRGELLRDVEGAVRRSAVGDDDLVVVPGLAGDAVEAGSQRRGSVQRGDHDRKQGRFHGVTNVTVLPDSWGQGNTQ